MDTALENKLLPFLMDEIRNIFGACSSLELKYSSKSNI
jgi:hypothetical protein